MKKKYRILGIIILCALTMLFVILINKDPEQVETEAEVLLDDHQTSQIQNSNASASSK